MNSTAKHAGRDTGSILRDRDLRHRVVGRCTRWVLDKVDAQLCPPGRLPARGIHRVLVIRPNHRLGNNILVSPLLKAVETTYPGAEIDVVSAGNAARELFSTRFHVRRIYSLPRHIARHLPSALRSLRELRRTRYDLAIDPCMASNSGHLLLGACKAQFKVGFPSGQGFEALRECDPDVPEHLAKCGVHALRKALPDAPPSSWPTLDMHLTPHELERGRRALEHILGGTPDDTGERPRTLGIFANATGAKKLPEAWWGKLLAGIHAAHPDLRIVDVLAEHGRSQLPGSTNSFYTRDLRKLAAVLANLQGFVSADCGVMHLAAAAGTPTLGLFVRGNRAKYTPYGCHNASLDVTGDDVADPEAIHEAIMAWIDQATCGDATTADARKPARQNAGSRE